MLKNGIKYSVRLNCRIRKPFVFPYLERNCSVTKKIARIFSFVFPILIVLAIGWYVYPEVGLGGAILAMAMSVLVGSGSWMVSKG